MLIISAYIKSLFNYCLLVWMFCNRGIMHKLNKIQELSLLTKLQGLFQDLLRSSGDISMHQRCINLLLIEAYKYIHALSPEIMNEVFSTTANIFKTRQFKCFQNSHTYLEQIWIEYDTLRSQPTLEITFWKPQIISVINSILKGEKNCGSALVEDI